MLDVVQFMLAPFAACLTLIGIHGYFGVHVLKREIIFIDIAMAQIAALGITVAYLLHINPESSITYFFSLGFTTVTAVIFAMLRGEKLKIPLEAIIGLSYAIATTAAVILIDKAAGSHEHIKEMLVGSILWVKWSEILKSAIIYSIVGAFHYIYRNKFLLVTENFRLAKEKGINVKLVDFFFYFTLGIVVMHSVRIGGILVVFAFLVIPASISALFSKKWTSRIIIGWVTGTIVSVFGLYLSWKLDVPSGPSVILFLGIFLFIAALLRKLNILNPD